MKRAKDIVLGVIIGLLLGASVVKADWSWGDFAELKKLVVAIERIATALEKCPR